MRRRLRCGRWLSFNQGQRSVDTGPMGCTRCPDRHRGAGKIRIVESSNSNEDQMRSCLRLAKERSAAIRAKSAVHSIAAVCQTCEVARFPYNLERRGAKAGAHGSAPCAQVLAIAAPAHPRGDRRFRAFPANRTAKAPACHSHCKLQGGERDYYSAGCALPDTQSSRAAEAEHLSK